MEFKKIKLCDAPKLNAFLQSTDELTCEISFVNLLLWQPLYNSYFCIEDNILFLKTQSGTNEAYSVPFGDVKTGFEKILKHCNNSYPTVWAQEGRRFREFKNLYGDNYNFIEHRNEFDYIYNSSNLINLSGKKYHSKRNHISAFSKQFDWHYEDITLQNIKEIKKCAELWYGQYDSPLDGGLITEMHGINLMLDNMENLGVNGGAIIVDNAVVAFTLGSPINKSVYDIHIEKAIPGFEAAYAVINREFASRNLNGYKFINRENDLGLEGLRRSKLSYKPEIILPKYICTEKEKYDNS